MRWGWVVALAGRTGEDAARQGYAVRVEINGYHEFWGWSPRLAVARGRLTRAARFYHPMVVVVGVVSMTYGEHRAHRGYRCQAGNCPAVLASEP